MSCIRMPGVLDGGRRGVHAHADVGQLGHGPDSRLADAGDHGLGQAPHSLRRCRMRLRGIGWMRAVGAGYHTPYRVPSHRRWDAVRGRTARSDPRRDDAPEPRGSGGVTLPTLPTTVVGSYPQPESLIDRERLSKTVPRVRMADLWRVPPDGAARGAGRGRARRHRRPRARRHRHRHGRRGPPGELLQPLRRRARGDRRRDARRDRRPPREAHRGAARRRPDPPRRPGRGRGPGVPARPHLAARQGDGARALHDGAAVPERALRRRRGDGDGLRGRRQRGAARPAGGRRRRRPDRRAVAAQRPGGRRALRAARDRPRAGGRHGDDGAPPVLRLRRAGAHGQADGVLVPAAARGVHGAADLDRGRAAAPRPRRARRARGQDRGARRARPRRPAGRERGDGRRAHPRGPRAPAARAPGGRAGLRHEVPAAGRRRGQARGARRGRPRSSGRRWDEHRRAGGAPAGGPPGGGGRGPRAVRGRRPGRSLGRRLRGRRRLPPHRPRGARDGRHGLPHRVDDEAHDVGRRAAARGARPARPRRRGRVAGAGVRDAAGARRLPRRRAGAAPAAGGGARPAAAHAYLGPGLQPVARRPAPLRAAHRRARARVRQARRVHRPAAGRRPGDGVQLQHVARLGRAGGRGGLRARRSTRTGARRCSAPSAWRTRRC